MEHSGLVMPARGPILASSLLVILPSNLAEHVPVPGLPASVPSAWPGQESTHGCKVTTSAQASLLGRVSHHVGGAISRALGHPTLLSTQNLPLLHAQLAHYGDRTDTIINASL